MSMSEQSAKHFLKDFDFRDLHRLLIFDPPITVSNCQRRYYQCLEDQKGVLDVGGEVVRVALKGKVRRVGRIDNKVNNSCEVFRVPAFLRPDVVRQGNRKCPWSHL